MGTYKCCLIFKRRFRWNDAPPPDDVRALFANHSAGGGPHMAADGLRAYLQATGQDGDVDMERLVEQIRQLQGRGGRIPRVGRALPLLTVDDFHRFLFSHELNPPIRHGQGQVHHDMAAPALPLLHLHRPQLLPHRQPAQQRLQRPPHHQGSPEGRPRHRARHVAQLLQG
ncbi:hypothetical protein EE612_041559 [Oryza sativa]|nr:hypothetical protein EE612_041559 [Oryza sativa]